MTKKHLLPKVTKRGKKRLGRGHGSGRGKTSGRGTKGQNARGTVPPHFEGGQLSVMKRLPFLRGKGRNKSKQTRAVTLTVGALANLPAKSDVTVALLKKQGLVGENVVNVKILSGGTLETALTVHVPCSKSAASVIEKAGGNVAA